MLHVVQANREKVARLRDAWAEARVRRHDRKASYINGFQRFQSIARKESGIEIPAMVAQVANLPFRIDESGALLSRPAMSDEFHCEVLLSSVDASESCRR
jgi:hypothetical protein